jgi:uncharacterized protein
VIALVILYGALEVIREGKRTEEERTTPRHPVATAAVISFAIGVLGGIVGLILGTLRLPAIVKWLGVAPKAAVGTNAATGVAVAIGGVIGHLTAGFDWDLLAAGAAGAIPGAWLGASMTGRLDDRALLRVVAAILVVAGVSLGVQAAVG